MSSEQHGEQHTLRVELVTPEGPAFVDDARMIIVPGADGELGVLPRHAPLVAQLDAGETRIHKTDQDWLAFATGSGYFKVQHDTALVLVSSAELAGEIDISAAERDRDEAQRRLEEAEASEEQGPESAAARRARRDLEDAENRLRVAHR
jgi:F-type H+-transporting ATPase subunit epsilon